MPDLSDVFMQGNSTPSEARSRSAAAELVLKGIAEGITDPEELKKLSGIKKSAELFITMDRLALRKEYHAALAKHGLTIDALVGGIAEHANDQDNKKLAFDAKRFLLKTLALDRPDSGSGDGSSWEEIVMRKAMETKMVPELPGETGARRYEVEIPEVPPDMREMADKLIAEGRGLGKAEEQVTQEDNG